jgi:hypothetical protein
VQAAKSVPAPRRLAMGRRRLAAVASRPQVLEELQPAVAPPAVVASRPQPLEELQPAVAPPAEMPQRR